jgi:hypothetical protein
LTGGHSKMVNLVITLDENELLDVQEILLDSDESAALRFLEKHIASKIPSKGDAPCDSSRRNPYLLKPDGSH